MTSKPSTVALLTELQDFLRIISTDGANLVYRQRVALELFDKVAVLAQLAARDTSRGCQKKRLVETINGAISAQCLQHGGHKGPHVNGDLAWENLDDEEVSRVQTENDRPESILPSLPQGALVKQREVATPPPPVEADRRALAKQRKLLELAFAFHVGIEGEYGCPGETCPGVQRLVAAFAALKGVGQRADIAALAAPSVPQPAITAIRRLADEAERGGGYWTAIQDVLASLASPAPAAETPKEST